MKKKTVTIGFEIPDEISDKDFEEWAQFEIEENPNDFTVIYERMSELANKTKQAIGEE